MAFLRGAVYAAPSGEYPPLVVIFGSGGVVVETHVTSSTDAGKASLAEIMIALQSKIDDSAGERRPAEATPTAA